MQKPLNSAIKQKTTNEIYDGIGKLLIEDNPDLLTITNISKRSGYSIGNIYHHFKNVDDVIDRFVSDRVAKRTAAMVDFIETAPSTQNAREFCKSFNDKNFHMMRTKLPKAMFLLLARNVLTKAKIIEKVNGFNLSLVDPIEAMIKRNETDTFKRLTHQEIELAILMSANAARVALVLNHKLVLTKSHQDMTLAVFIALFTK